MVVAVEGTAFVRVAVVLKKRGGGMIMITDSMGFFMPSLTPMHKRTNSQTCEFCVL